jgi:hypothetical protein
MSQLDAEIYGDTRPWLISSLADYCEIRVEGVGGSKENNAIGTRGVG